MDTTDITLKCFYIKQFPLVHDVIKEINKLMMKQERYIVIDKDLDNDFYSSVDCHNTCLTIAKMYIKNGQITSIMRLDYKKTSILQYKKALIHSQFLSLTSSLNTLYPDKNGMIKKVLLDDLSKCKQGYYTCKLPLILKHQIV